MGHPRAGLSAHLEGDVLAGLSEGMSQEEHVIHTNAERQKGQHLSESSQYQHGDTATTRDKGTHSSSPSIYLCGGCIEGDTKQ